MSRLATLCVIWNARALDSRFDSRFDFHLCIPACFETDDAKNTCFVCCFVDVRILSPIINLLCTCLLGWKQSKKCGNGEQHDTRHWQCWSKVFCRQFEQKAKHSSVYLSQDSETPTAPSQKDNCKPRWIYYWRHYWLRKQRLVTGMLFYIWFQLLTFINLDTFTVCQ